MYWRVTYEKGPLRPAGAYIGSVPLPACVFAERVVSQVLSSAIDFINTSESFVQKRRMKRKRFILSMAEKHE